MTKKRRINYFIPVAVIGAIGMAIFFSSKTFKVYQQEKAKADDMRSELDTLQRNNQKSRVKDQLMNPVQKEEEARRMGYVRPEETSLPDKSGQAPAEKTDENVPVEKKPTPAAPPIDLHDDHKEDTNAEPQ